MTGVPPDLARGLATAMPAKVYRQRLADGITMFIVTVLSLALLLYVAFGEGKRGYEQLHLEKITAQGRLVQSSIEKFLRDDLPLKQYAGFTTLVTPIVESEDFDAIAVYDHLGRQLFSVVVISPTNVVTQRLRASFSWLPFAGIGLSLLFAVLVTLAAPLIERSRFPWRHVGYGATFVLMSGLVVFTLVTLYYDGVQGKAKASAFTLSQRLNDIVEFKLDVKDFIGLDGGFREYRRLNSEISEAALIVNGRVEIATEEKTAGKQWTADAGNFEYMVELSRGDQLRRTSLVVTVPRHVIYERVARTVKNFAALFIASAFLAGLFLQVAGS